MSKSDRETRPAQAPRAAASKRATATTPASAKSRSIKAPSSPPTAAKGTAKRSGTTERKTATANRPAKSAAAKLAAEQPASVAQAAKPVTGRAAPAAKMASTLSSTPAQAQQPWSFDPAALAKVQSDYLERMGSLLQAGPQSAAPRDRRFSSPAWSEGLFGWNAALYELNAEFMTRLADAFDGDAKSRDRVRFATQQWIDAVSPTNFLVSNPDAQQKLFESGGKSLTAGLENLLADMQRGRISQTDETAFEVGRDLAITPGKVVFENPMFQLVQYDPATPTVGELPLLMVPPCINKFYILDLQPENSLVAHMVSQGHTVFMLSWRNVREDQGKLTWDDYLSQGVGEAIRVTREICGTDQINALGFCVGGTIISTALAAFAARGERPVRSLTLLTTLLDFENAGVLNIFVDEAHVALREATLGNGGIMAGAELAQTFSSLRPNDLIWNYVVRNYLYGEAPPAFDLLFWNADSTNLPGPMFCWYLRHMYLQNDLREPGRLTCLDQPIDLGAIDVPVYLYASREDHIVPWTAAYASTDLLSNEARFVLGASGHIAGVINPPAKNKRNYWVNDQLTPLADDWFAGATQMPGSWWTDWVDWLSAHRGREVPARQPGQAGYPALENAPGSYVRARASD